MANVDWNAAQIGTYYTHGVWTIAAGREQEFVERWTALSRWTHEQAPGAGTFKLLRDANRPNVFVSIGPWASREDAEGSRRLDGWRELVAAMDGDLIVRSDPHLLQVVAESGPGAPA